MREEGGRGTFIHTHAIPHSITHTSLPGSFQVTLAVVLVMLMTEGLSGICGGPTGIIITSITASRLSRSTFPPSMSMLTAVMDILRAEERGQYICVHMCVCSYLTDR